MPKPKTADRAIDIGLASTREVDGVPQARLEVHEKTAWMLRSLIEA